MWRRELISTYYKTKDLVAKVIHQDRMFIVEYYNNGTKFHTEEYPDKSIHYVEDAAENWALGIKKLEEGIEPLSDPHKTKNWPFP